MADSNLPLEGGTDSPTAVEEAPWFGVLDGLLIAFVVVVIVLLVRRFTKKKNNDDTQLRALQINPVMIGRPVTAAGSSEGSFIDKMKSRKKRLVVFYGSQTGTAEEFAARLAKDAARQGLPAMTFDPEDCSDWDDLAKLGDEIEGSMAIFCMATYGEGDPTDNAQDLHEWLKERSDSLQGLNYAVFGLGNRTYEHYNAMGVFFDERLAKLGAQRVFKSGDGDDDGNIEEDFVTWKEQLWPVVCQHFGIDSSQALQVGREYEVTVHTDLAEEKIFTGEPSKLGSLKHQKTPYNSKNPFMSAITVNRELHKGGDRSCMHIELDITGSKLSYVTGDHVAIFPTNNTDAVERIGELLGADLDTVFSLTNVDDQASKKHPFPCPTTYRAALTHYVDINSPPRTHVLRELAEHTSDPEQKEFLLKMTSPTDEGKRLYNQWIRKDQRNIVAVFEDLTSFRPPVDQLLELLPRLQVRYYSISSSPKLHPNSVHITAVLVEYTTNTNRVVKGVATSWLKNMVPTADHTYRVPIYIRHSSLRLPYRPSNPVIMVGPGTGLAPFRGFIQERSAVNTNGNKLGETVLYFGCRRKNEDYIYQEELEEFHQRGILSGLHVAFSRDQAEKEYVQHKMLESGETLWELLEKQGYFYVCGDARNMARDVQNTLLSVIKKHGNLSDEEASDYVKKLQKKGRYLQDVWS